MRSIREKGYNGEKGGGIPNLAIDRAILYLHQKVLVSRKFKLVQSMRATLLIENANSLNGAKNLL